MEFEIIKAVRTSSPVSIFIEGESGSGKTYSALLMARGLAGPDGKIGIIDTEGGRSLIYADDKEIGGFEYMAFTAPYSPARFIQAIDAAIADGWKVIVIDSASLEHDGEGGLIEMAENESASGKNSMQKWIKPKFEHKKFLNHSVGLPAHIIMCFRQTITTDFSAKPPASIMSTVAEKNTKFVMEIHCTITADHKAHWSRIPKPYAHCVEQDSLITIETGAKIGTASDCRDDVQVAIDDWKDKHEINDADFNKALSVVGKVQVDNWTELPVERLQKVATPKVLDLVLKQLS